MTTPSIATTIDATTTTIGATTRPPRARGYLLSEAMIAGALLAVASAATLGLVAASAAQERYATNRATATMLARAKSDELASSTNCSPPNQGAFTAVSAQFNTFQWKWTVANAGNTAQSTPPITAGKLCDISVTVRYPTAVRSREDLADGVADGHAIVSFSRLYKP